jgi:hypothetical protein
MIEAAFYPSDTSEFRLSIRVAPDSRDKIFGNKMLSSVVSLYRFFMYP